MPVRDLIGRNVHSANGVEIGQIEQVATYDGVASGLVGMGSMPGLGDQTVAVPLSQFDVTHDGDIQLENVTVTQVETMPAIDTDLVVPLDDAILIGDLG